MVRDIRAARTRVWLETYIFHDDAAGLAIAEALRERARRRRAGSRSLRCHRQQGHPLRLLRALEQAGVQVARLPFGLGSAVEFLVPCASSIAAIIASCWSSTIRSPTLAA